MLFGKRIQHSKDVLIDGEGCRYLLPNLQENIALDIFVNGTYEPETVKFLKSIIPQNGRFLDLGANIGAVLIPLCKARQDIRAIAVEAAPWVFEYLARNVQLNKLNGINLVNKALFDKDDEELNFYSPALKFGKGSLSPVFSEEGVKVLTVKVDTLLDQMNFPSVDTIKIDVEGFEYFAFRGAETQLRREKAPDIVFEFVDWAEDRAMGIRAGAAQEFILSMGYNLFSLNEQRLIALKSPMLQGAANLFASKRMR